MLQLFFVHDNMCSTGYIGLEETEAGGERERDSLHATDVLINVLYVCFSCYTCLIMLLFLFFSVTANLYNPKWTVFW